MKRFYIIFLLLCVAFVALLHYSGWWSLTAIGAGMLLTAYNFYLTRLQSANARILSLTQEVEALSVQLDSSISKEQKAINEAEKTKEAKSRLLATVNHEIRTPMNGMLGMTSLLSATTVSDDQREYIDTIRFCGENLMTTVNEMLVSDLLNFSKSDHQGDELDKRDFDLRNCIKDALMMFAGRATQEGSTLFYRIEAGVPEQVNGDRKRLSQILMNLVDNAVKNTKNGEIFLNIRNVTVPANAKDAVDCLGLEFELQDTGCGIPKDKIDQLFTGIAQPSVTNGAAALPGLGLVLCKKLVELMGGSIKVESKPGQGSSFLFSICCHPALKPKFSPLHPGSSEAGKKIQLTRIVNDETSFQLSPEFALEFPLRILVAEDNSINQKLAIKMLGMLGYEAALAHNGKEVMEMADLAQYDVILMDVQMPVMDGLEATRMIRLCLKKQPVIIAMTANAMEGDQNDCIQAGMDDYICKPFEVNDLLVKLGKWGAAIKAGG
jgi:two-component system sensor histidine kinase/response regulator